MHQSSDYRGQSLGDLLDVCISAQYCAYSGLAEIPKGEQEDPTNFVFFAWHTQGALNYLVLAMTIAEKTPQQIRYTLKSSSLHDKRQRRSLNHEKIFDPFFPGLDS